MSKKEQEIYEFHNFRLDIGKSVLVRDGQPISLQWKTFELLCLLIKSNGNLITRNEVMEVLWADTFVEDNNLSQHIGALRKALGENGNGAKFIETVAGRGYRFVPEVKEISAPETSSIDNFKEANLKSEDKVEHTSTSQTKINRIWLSILAAAIILAASLSIYLYNRNSNKVAI